MFVWSLNSISSVSRGPCLSGFLIHPLCLQRPVFVWFPNSTSGASRGPCLSGLLIPSLVSPEVRVCLVS
jgi:hypothetical protein